MVTRLDGKTIGFSYDTSGRLQEILIPEEEITFVYHATTGNVGVTYNNDFMITSQSANDGNSVSYGYDDDGLLRRGDVFVYICL